MKQHIGIVDYGMGNLRSVQKGFEHIDCTTKIIRDEKDFQGISHLVVPGVGAFKMAMDTLVKMDLLSPILDTIKRGTPFLGICLGLQILFSESTEFGASQGMDILKGKVVKFPDVVKIPHMGWNPITRCNNNTSSLLDEIPDGTYMYFNHSYYVTPDNSAITLTKTDYGVSFTSAVAFDNIFGTQFHPEKSQKFGIKLLWNFSQLQ